MSATTQFINSDQRPHPRSKRTSTKTKLYKYPQKALLRLPPSTASPSPCKDFILFPQWPGTNKEGSCKATPKPIAPKSQCATQRPLSPPLDHVIEPKAANPSMRKPRIDLGDFKCLNHLSLFNCTAECLNALPVAGVGKPPPAPSTPRLPTPDLSDVDEDEMFPCYRSENTEDQAVSPCETGIVDDLGKLRVAIGPKPQGTVTDTF